MSSNKEKKKGNNSLSKEAINKEKDCLPTVLNPKPPAHLETEFNLVESYRKRARTFFENELDEKEWDISEEPKVSMDKYGAYVQFWRWFPAEEENE